MHAVQLVKLSLHKHGITAADDRVLLLLVPTGGYCKTIGIPGSGVGGATWIASCKSARFRPTSQQACV